MSNELTPKQGLPQAEEPSNEQETIFSKEEFSMEGYDKNIRNARTALFVVSAIQLIAAIITGSTQGGDVGLFSFIFMAAVAVVFFLLALWSKKKPYTAILVALILYVGLLVVDAMFDPETIFKGLVMKVIIIVYLARSINDAREAQNAMKHFGGGQ